MKIWIDDVRPAPPGYIHIESVSEAIEFVRRNYASIELLDIDHDAGDFASQGGDYVKLLDFLEAEYGDRMSIPVHLHSMNPVGISNMRRIIARNGWKEVM